MRNAFTEYRQWLLATGEIFYDEVSWKLEFPSLNLEDIRSLDSEPEEATVAPWLDEDNPFGAPEERGEGERDFVLSKEEAEAVRVRDKALRLLSPPAGNGAREVTGTETKDILFVSIVDLIEGLHLDMGTLRRWTCEVVADRILENNEAGFRREDVIKVLYHRTEKSSRWADEFYEMSCAIDWGYQPKLNEFLGEVEVLPEIPPAQISWDVLAFSLNSKMKQQVAKYFVLRETVGKLFGREMPREADWFDQIEHPGFVLREAWDCVHILKVAAQAYNLTKEYADDIMQDGMWEAANNWL